MTHSRYPHHFGPGGPDVSADLVTTAVDYEQPRGRSSPCRSYLSYPDILGESRMSIGVSLGSS